MENSERKKFDIVFPTTCFCLQSGFQWQALNEISALSAMNNQQGVIRTLSAQATETTSNQSFNWYVED